MYLMVVLTKTNFNKILIIILVESCVTLTKIVEYFSLKKKEITVQEKGEVSCYCS